MFCPTCGQATKGSERFCSNCGSDLTTTGAVAAPMGQPVVGPPPAALHTPASTPSSATTAAVPVASPAAPVSGAQLRGVGGWLLLFCIWVTILDPLLDLRILPYLRYLSNNPMLLINLALSVFGVVIGILLWSGKRSGVTLLRVYFPAVAIMSVFGLVRYLGYFRNMEPNLSLVWTLVSTWGRIFTFLVVWVWYFRVSVRVRNTYGMNL